MKLTFENFLDYGQNLSSACHALLFNRSPPRRTPPLPVHLRIHLHPCFPRRPNTITAPGYVSTDFSLSKDTKIFERLSTQFRAEIFNIFNHANFGVPALNAFTAVGGLTGSPTGLPGNASNAGQINSIVGTSRQIQLALKFLF